jgi:hypothetical protein
LAQHQTAAVSIKKLKKAGSPFKFSILFFTADKAAAAAVRSPLIAPAVPWE